MRYTTPLAPTADGAARDRAVRIRMQPVNLAFAPKRPHLSLPFDVAKAPETIVGLNPRGVIPRDPKLSVKMQPFEPILETEVIERGPCDVDGTTALLDNFEGVGLAVNHRSDSGATYAITDGNTDDGAYVVRGGVLRRPDFAEDEDGAGSESFIEPSQQPANNRFAIDVDVRFKGKRNGDDPLYSFVAICQGGSTSNVLCEINSQGLGNDAGLKDFNNVDFVTVADELYRMRLIVDGACLTLCINGAIVATGTNGAGVTGGPYGLNTFNFNGIDNFEIERFEIIDVAGDEDALPELNAVLYYNGTVITCNNGPEFDGPLGTAPEDQLLEYRGDAHCVTLSAIFQAPDSAATVHTVSGVGTYSSISVITGNAFTVNWDLTPDASPHPFIKYHQFGDPGFHAEFGANILVGGSPTSDTNDVLMFGYAIVLIRP